MIIYTIPLAYCLISFCHEYIILFLNRKFFETHFLETKNYKQITRER
jgi:hypothetical protein